MLAEYKKGMIVPKDTFHRVYGNIIVRAALHFINCRVTFIHHPAKNARDRMNVYKVVGLGNSTIHIFYSTLSRHASVLDCWPKL